MIRHLGHHPQLNARGPFGPKAKGLRTCPPRWDPKLLPKSFKKFPAIEFPWESGRYLRGSIMIFFVGFMSHHTFRAASSIRPLKHPPQSHGARNCQHGRPIKASRKGKPMAPVRGSCLSGGLRLRPLKGLMRPFLHLVLFVFATRWSLDAAQLLSCGLCIRIRKKNQQAWNKI